MFVHYDMYKYKTRVSIRIHILAVFPRHYQTRGKSHRAIANIRLSNLYFDLCFAYSRQQFSFGQRSDRRLSDRLLQRVVLQDFRIQSGGGELFDFNYLPWTTPVVRSLLFTNNGHCLE